MTTQSVHDQNVVYVEYCRSCQTHSWCTHHDQAKYHDTYLKLSEMLTQHYPHLEIIGNMVPSHLIPFKIAENKYIDSNTNKYVVYPQIGSFEVRLNSTTIFSKKETNSWPNLQAILSKISSIINPNYQSPSKIENTSKQPKKSNENTPSKTHKNNDFLKSNDEKKTYYKDQAKGFTLTDHFKIYKSKLKHEEKDWLTEKHESDGSSRQISEFGRGESRERSERGDQFKSVMSDFSGDSKLKEMLKHKGLTLKDHGKKEMIIKLDSIEEQNGNYEDFGATQRTAEKPTKKTQKIEELENAFSNLQNKFIRFQSKVKDIQNKNDNFDYRKPDSNESQVHLNIRETDKSKKDEIKRSNVKHLPSFEKQGGAFVERPSKLEIYLNASEQEKNEKLYRIYGQWKVLKQAEKRNKKLLKNINRKAQNQGSSDEQTSQNDSASPSSMANVLTFKPKMENNIQKQITSLLKNNKGQKYSTIQKVQTPNTVARDNEPKFRTDDHFYNKNYLRKPRIDSENEKQSDYSSKLFKNSTNTMSLQALRGGVKLSLSKNASMNQINAGNLSQSAKQNISKINARISNIQAQLNKHKQNQMLIKMGLEPQPFSQIRDHNKSRSNSDASSQLSSKKFSYKNGKQLAKKGNEEARNSYRGDPLKKAGHAALVKRSSKFSETNGRYNSKKPKNQSTNIQATIQEESQILDSNVVTQRSQEHYREQSGAKQNKKTFMNKKTENARKQMGKREQQQKQTNCIDREREQISDSQETSGQNTKRQKESRIQQHELHEPVVFLRKQKEWREAGGTKQSSRKQPKHISQHAEGNGSNLLREANEANKFRFSEAKNSPSKPAKSNKARGTQGLAQTPKKRGKPIQEVKDNLAVFQKGQKSSFGKIKKNKKKDELLLRQNSNSSNNYSVEAHQDQAEGEAWEQEDVSNPSSGEAEGDPIREQHSQPASGRIVRNNSKPLSYYKSQDIVIQGQSRSINSASEGLNIDSSGIEIEGQADLYGGEDSSMKEQAKRQKMKKRESRRSSNERVAGWETNSEPGEDQLMASLNEEQDAVSAEQQEESEGSNKRRNSLDNELEQIDSARKGEQAEGKVDNKEANHENEERQDEIALVPSQTKSVGQFHNDADAPLVSSVSAPEVNEAPILPDVSRQVVPFPQVTGPANAESELQNPSVQQTNLDDKSAEDKPVQKVTPIKPKKSKKARKGQPKKQSSNATDPKQTKTESKCNKIQDIEKTICQQYASYLNLKIINELCKPQPPQNDVESKEYEDVEFTVHVSYCPSSDTIPEGQFQCPNSFMEYNPLPTASDQQEEMKNKSEPEREDIEQEDSQQQSSQQQEQEQMEEEKYKSADKEEPKEEQQVDSRDEEKIAGEVNVMPVVPALQHTQSVPSNAASQSANSAKLVSSASPSLLTSSPLASSLEPISEHQANNVYCQPKDASKFKQIGIQKQSTLQVSVQTEYPQAIYPVMLTRVNSITSYPEESKQEEPRNIFQLHQTKSDFNNTVRNNFVNESKKTAFDKKPKKQIQRADIINKIYSQDLSEELQKFAGIIKGSSEQIAKEEGLVLKLEEMYPNGPLIGEKGLEIELITTKFTNMLKVIEILCEKSEWLISRLFEDKHGMLQSRAFGVWLCYQYQWRCIIVDEHLLVDQHNQPLYSKHHGNQLWYNVLEKALAIALGGYDQLIKADSSLLFTMLTGCNAIFAKVKEDPTKNAKLLHLVTDCLRKNYIIHAHKNYDKSKLEEGREAVYYVCSVRRSGEDETLVEVSQDGRESFWVKLSKFVQEFSKIDILHLRINHNFAHLDLGVGRPGQLTVIELGFFDEGQGCVTLSYLGQTGALKAYLYKEQKNKVLKLVGQAKEKLKSHLFFECSFMEGRYFVFAQAEEKPTRIAFLGQGQPSIRITEEIHSEGLKNELAEYLPVKENDQNRLKQRAQLQSGNEWRERRGPRLKDNFMESRLRQTFMDYVVGRSRRN